MKTRRSPSLIVLPILGISACLPALAGPPKDKFAVFTQKDPGFTETITLFTDGRYKQEETQSEDAPYRLGSLHGPAFPLPALPFLWGGSRDGGWLILDKEGGVPILYKPGEKFPATAVIELKSAMPFGFVWDNQSPFGMHGDRYLEAGLGQMTAPPAQPLRSGVLTPGSPLPPLVKPQSPY